MSRTTGKPSEGGRTGRSWLRFRIGYLAMLAAMALFSVKFAQQALADHEKALRLDAATAALTSQSKAIAQLRTELRDTNSRSFIVNQARVWGYVPRGYGVVSISYQHVPRGRHTFRRTIRTAAPPPWQQWWDAFFGSAK